MIAQIGLSILLLGAMFYAWTEYSRAPAIGLVSMVVAAAGLYFVWLPSDATLAGDSGRHRPRRRSHPLCLGDHQFNGDVEPAPKVARANGADNGADAGDR